MLTSSDTKGQGEREERGRVEIIRANSQGHTIDKSGPFVSSRAFVRRVLGESGVERTGEASAHSSHSAAFRSKAYELIRLRGSSPRASRWRREEWIERDIISAA